MEEYLERFKYNKDACIAEGSFGKVRLAKTGMLLPASVHA